VYRSSEYKNAMEKAQPELISFKHPFVSMKRLKSRLGVDIRLKVAGFWMNMGLLRVLL